MKRLAYVLLGTTAAVGLTMPVLAQSARSQLYSTPLPPPREVLDRLNLQMNWRVYVPMDGRHDGLATVQLHGPDLYVQTRSGMMALLDAETGVTRWRSPRRSSLPCRTRSGLQQPRSLRHQEHVSLRPGSKNRSAAVAVSAARRRGRGADRR